MHDCQDSALTERWFPIAASGDVPRRHVHQAQLLGQELAVWRADDGFVNVWENRCLHRGVRLSIGLNLGNELRCMYHGWRYASRSAGCTYIPAHPANAPARQICNKTFAATERYGLIWSCLAAGHDFAPVAALEGGSFTALRSIPIGASAPLVAEALLDYRFVPGAQAGAAPPAAATCRMSAATPFMITGESEQAGEHGTVVLFVQPVDQARSIVHGLMPEPPGDRRLAVLRHHNDQLSALRDRLEGSGRTLLDLASPAEAPALAYRTLLGAGFSYGLAG